MKKGVTQPEKRSNSTKKLAQIKRKKIDKNNKMSPSGNKKIIVRKHSKAKIEANREYQRSYRERQDAIDKALDIELDELMARTEYLVDKVSSNWKKIKENKIMEKSVLIYGDDVIEPAMFIGNIDDYYWDRDIEDVWEDPFNYKGLE